MVQVYLNLVLQSWFWRASSSTSIPNWNGLVFHVEDQTNKINDGKANVINLKWSKGLGKGLGVVFFQITKPQEDRRNNTRLYNPLKVSEVQGWTDSAVLGQINWKDYLASIYGEDITDDERVIVVETEYLKQLVTLLDATPLRTVGKLLQTALSVAISWRRCGGWLFFFSQLRSLAFGELAGGRHDAADDRLPVRIQQRPVGNFAARRSVPRTVLVFLGTYWLLFWDFVGFSHL